MLYHVIIFQKLPVLSYYTHTHVRASYPQTQQEWEFKDSIIEGKREKQITKQIKGRRDLKFFNKQY